MRIFSQINILKKYGQIVLFFFYFHILKILKHFLYYLKKLLINQSVKETH